jgi:L-lactate dehydrogenase
LPLGGLDSGHKGFALGLLVEALTASLGGFGRADQPDRWGASVFLQIIDPQAFGGLEKFKRETGWLAAACRNAGSLPGGPGVRLPGQRGLELRRGYLARGVELAPTIMPLLQPWAAKLGVSLPSSI